LKEPGCCKKNCGRGNRGGLHVTRSWAKKRGNPTDQVERARRQHKKEKKKNERGRKLLVLGDLRPKGGRTKVRRPGNSNSNEKKEVKLKETKISTEKKEKKGWLVGAAQRGKESALSGKREIRSDWGKKQQHRTKDEISRKKEIYEWRSAMNGKVKEK